jgi:hypothetical protein
MQRGVTGVAAVVEEVVGLFVYLLDRHHTLRRRLALAEMSADSALTIMHRLRFEFSA